MTPTKKEGRKEEETKRENSEDGVCVWGGVRRWRWGWNTKDEESPQFYSKVYETMHTHTHAYAYIHTTRGKKTNEADS